MLLSHECMERIWQSFDWSQRLRSELIQCYSFTRAWIFSMKFEMRQFTPFTMVLEIGYGRHYRRYPLYGNKNCIFYWWNSDLIRSFCAGRMRILSTVLPSCNRFGFIWLWYISVGCNFASAYVKDKHRPFHISTERLS